MLSADEAKKKMDAGEHVVEITITWMDMSYESFYPTEHGWHVSSDLIVISGGECNRIEFPLINIRYYEVFVHNPPPADPLANIMALRFTPEGIEVIDARTSTTLSEGGKPSNGHD